MTAIENQAIKLMAEEMVRAIKKLTEDNNRSYVDNQIKNVTVSGASGGHADTANSITGSINVSQVKGFNSAIAGFIAGAPGNAENGDADAEAVMNAIGKLVSIEVEHAKIDTAQIENLYATVADFIYMAAEKAEIGDLEAEKIVATIAKLGLVDIDKADIGWAQVKDLTTDTAIIREGLGGKLYIDKLAVTEANMVSLTVGELIVKGDDGNFYSLIVNEDGSISTELKQVEGDNIANNTIEGGKLIENTITARELNVSKIFADEALVGAIKASNIDVSDLFANNAFISKLETGIISSPRVGKEIDLNQNSSITLTNQRISLLIENGNETTELTLTDEMIYALADKFDLIADKIDLSANDSINMTVSNIVTDAIREDVGAKVELIVGYRIEIDSTSDVLSSKVGTTVLTARVMNGQKNVTDELEDSLFNWKRITDDTVADEQWNKEHIGMKSIVLTRADVYKSAVYQCDLTDFMTSILGEAVLGEMVLGK